MEEKDPPVDSEAEPLDEHVDEYSDYYGDDFESLSNAGSLLRSRQSLRSSLVNSKKKE